MKSLYPPDLDRNTLSSLYIYSDLIQSNITGDSQAPLMRIVPVDSTSKGLVIFISMTYSKARGGRINMAKFWITENLNGIPIKFRSNVTLKLMLEKWRI